MGPFKPAFFVIWARNFGKNFKSVDQYEEKVQVSRKRRRRQDERRTREPAKPLTPELREAIEGWALEAAEVHGLLLWDLELSAHGRWIIKVFVDVAGAKPGEGVSVGQCEQVSRYLETILDAEEGVATNYLLEVSSPGIERPLKNESHLELVVGQDVELVLREPIQDSNKVSGRLLAYQDGILKVQDGEEELAVAWEQVARAKLKFDF